MTNKRKWTDHEDSVVVSKMQENAGNIRQNFKDLAVQLNRTEHAVHYRWYYVLSNPSSPKYIGSTCLILITKNQKLANRKNCQANSKVTPEPISERIFKKILKWLHLDLSLILFHKYNVVD